MNLTQAAVQETCIHREMATQREEGSAGAKLLYLPRNKEEAYSVMQIIHHQKVEYLKRAIFELQRQNTILTDELAQATKQKYDLETKYLQTSPLAMENNMSADQKMNAESQQDLLKELQQTLGNLSALGTDPINEKLLSSEIINSHKIQNLEEKIKQLEREVVQQRLLVQQHESQVKSLLKSRAQMLEKFQKQLKLQKNKISSEMQALLLEERAKNLLAESNHGTERSRQLERFVSAFHERFQDMLLDVQAKSSQSRINDLQRINELEKKLTGSLKES